MSSLARPTGGSYEFRASGKEEVSLGGYSPCSWELDKVIFAIHDEKDGTVLDIDFGAHHQERVILLYSSEGLAMSYFGAVIKCNPAPPETDEGSYDPPVSMLRWPPAQGAAWTGSTKSSTRLADYSVKVVGLETVQVPAGSFDAWQVQISLRSDGDDPVSRQETIWFAPKVGMWVKQRVITDATKGGFKLHSDYSLELARYPG